MIRLRNFLFPLLVGLALSGCLYDKPLTSTASTNIDTRLLGVFEFGEKTKKKDHEDKPDRKKDDESGGSEQDSKGVQRVAVLPHGEDTYLIYYRDYGKKPVKTLTFIGWISRVDQDYYLTFRDETEGSPTYGKYGFVRFEWRWPGNFEVFTPDMNGFETAASDFQMRKMLRKKLKDGTAFPYQSTYWTKIARVWWDKKNPDPLTTVPVEFETGRESKRPLY